MWVVPAVCLVMLLLSGDHALCRSYSQLYCKVSGCNCGSYSQLYCQVSGCDHATEEGFKLLEYHNTKTSNAGLFWVFTNRITYTFVAI